MNITPAGQYPCALPFFLKKVALTRLTCLRWIPGNTITKTSITGVQHDPDGSPDKLDRNLRHCTIYHLTKSEAVKRALEDLLKPAAAGKSALDHPFIGCDKGDGSDASGNIRRLLRERFRKTRR